MIFTGFYKGSFKDKTSGKDISFAKLYLSTKGDDIYGMRTNEYKTVVNDDFLNEVKRIPLGSEVSVYFDEYKRVNLIHVVKG